MRIKVRFVNEERTEAVLIRGRWFRQRAAFVKLIKEAQEISGLNGATKMTTVERWVFAKNQRPLDGVYLTRLTAAREQAIIDEPWVPLSTAQAMQFADDPIAPAKALAAPRGTFEVDEQPATQ